MPLALIAFGGAVVIVALSGFLGTVWNSQKLLTVYAVLLAALIQLEASLAIVSLVYPKTVRSGAESAVRRTLDDYSTDLIAQTLWDTLQAILGCCGIHSPDDWVDKLEWPLNAPLSCCTHNSTDYVKAEWSCNVTNVLELPKESRGGEISTTGCAELLEEKILPLVSFVWFAALSVAGLEMVALAAAVYLATTA